MQARNEWSEIFKVLRGKKKNYLESVLSKIILEKYRRNKDFLRQTKTEPICY